MKFKMNRVSQIVAAGLLLGGASFAAQAEITLIKQDPQPYDLLSRLDFKVGGSIRPQFQNSMGNSDKGSFKNNGYDGGTRFRFTADYFLFDDVHWISYYELGVNIPAVFSWDQHYQKGVHDTTRRQLYTGFKSNTYGTLTFGQQNSIYYDVVGAKTDVWDDDMLAQAPGNGINGDYDGSYRSRKMLKYKYAAGPVDLYAAYLFADDDLLVNGNNIAYRRNGGGSVGANWHITKDLAWGTAYNFTNADVKNRTTEGSKDYDQSILGTALAWTPGNWSFSAGGGWYHDFLMTKLTNEQKYFAGNAYGVEYLAGYTFPINSYAVQSIKPYVMGDHLEYVSGRNYQRTDNGVGVSVKLNYGFQVDFEHVITNSTDDISDLNLVRLYYNF
ncbi:MAG: porin [Rouxiella aceris]|uniref:porin n=1 Tax=Rouxiella aceris TaxID=2703884 RepID=UPI0028471ABF|nr:porin [Rouxiella aceris]MDR3433565.1 porin [Rouxiella aceris]